MIHRALLSPCAWKQNLLLAMATGSAVILLGCGGGGGGGGSDNTRGVCGSSAGSTATVVCGRVVGNDSTGVVNAKVTFLNSAGVSVGSVLTVNDATYGTGFYKFTVPSGTTQFMVEAPSPYYSNTMTYGNPKLITYAYYVSSLTGGQCMPALTVPTANTDNYLTNVLVYNSESGPPPLPVNPCPR